VPALKWELKGVYRNALDRYIPERGEPWLKFLARRENYINRHVAHFPQEKRQSLASREAQGRDWSIIANNRTVIYRLDENGCIIHVESHTKSSSEIHREHAPWDRRYLPAMAQWDICTAFYRPECFKPSPDELQGDPYDDDDSEAEDGIAYNNGVDVACSKLTQEKWSHYKSNYLPFISAQDFNSVRPEDPPLLHRPLGTPPHSPGTNISMPLLPAASEPPLAPGTVLATSPAPPTSPSSPPAQVAPFVIPDGDLQPSAPVDRDMLPPVRQYEDVQLPALPEEGQRRPSPS
jgi:hypothetical protein